MRARSCFGVLVAIVGSVGGTGSRPVPPPRLEPGLAAVLASAEPATTALALGYRVASGRIQVVAQTNEAYAPQLEAWLGDRGATEVSSFGGLVQAHVTGELLEELAALPDVERVRKPHYVAAPDPSADKASTAVMGQEVHATAATISEGVAPMNAGAWQVAGFAGQGIKVGVIDYQFGGYPALVGTELPAQAEVHFWSCPACHDLGGNHGTGCAELIHDVAPSAELYLAQIGTEVDFGNALSWLRGNGVKVVSFSCYFLDQGPGDGSGLVDGLVNDFAAGGGFWANCAGNFRLGHWQGAWRDDGNTGWLHFDATTTTNRILSYGRTGPRQFAAGEALGTAYLVWNQFPSRSTALRLVRVRFDGSQWQLVQDATATGAAPYIEMPQIPAPAAGVYGFQVQRLTAPTSGLEVELINRNDLSPLEVNVQDCSLGPPADAQGAVAVAGLDVLAPYGLLDLSSKGPNHAAGSVARPGALKPDLAGYSNVSTVSFGLRSVTGGMGGTSAAAPHVAGAAAVVWCGFPEFTGGQVRALLQSRAVDMGPPGQDADYGFGRLYLGAPPSSTCDSPPTPGDLGTSSAHVESGVTFTLTWSAVAESDGYDIQEAPDASFSRPATFSATSASFSRAELVGAQTTFFFRVRATRSCGRASAWSSAISITVAPAAVPRLRRHIRPESSAQLLSTADPYASCPMPDGATSVYRGTALEPHVAIGGAGANRTMMVTWRQDLPTGRDGTLGIVAAYSPDGRSWTASPVPFTKCVAGGVQFDVAANAKVAVGPDGTAYVVAVGFGGPHGEAGGLFAATMRQGKGTWTNTHAIEVDMPSSGRHEDEPSVTADPTMPGTAYAVWMNPTTGSQQIKMAKTIDYGATWQVQQLPLALADPMDGNWPVAVVDPAHQALYVFCSKVNSFQCTASSNPSLRFIRSLDGGTTWGQERSVVQASDCCASYFGVAVDPIGGDLFLAWIDGGFSGAPYGNLAVSGDLGNTWSTPTTWTADGGGYRAVSVAVAGDGTVGVFYPAYDYAKGLMAYWLRTSHDRGKTLGNPEPVGAAFDPRSSPGGGFMGDWTMQACADGDAFHLAFAGTTCPGSACQGVVCNVYFW